jgi:hypothetical protein
MNEEKQPGKYPIRFDAGSLPSGVYFYRLEVIGDNSGNSYSETKKMVLIK